LCSTWGRFGSKMVFLDMEHLRLCLAQAPSECRNAWDRTGTSDCGESSVLELLLATVGHAGAKSLVPRQSWNNRDKQAPSGNNLERVKKPYRTHVVACRKIRKHILFCICGKKWFRLCMLDPWEIILHTPPCRRIHSIVRNKGKTLERVWLSGGSARLFES
jgi:hypothetical protein